MSKIHKRTQSNKVRKIKKANNTVITTTTSNIKACAHSFKTYIISHILRQSMPRSSNASPSTAVDHLALIIKPSTANISTNDAKMEVMDMDYGINYPMDDQNSPAHPQKIPMDSNNNFSPMDNVDETQLTERFANMAITNLSTMMLYNTTVDTPPENNPSALNLSEGCNKNLINTK